MDFRTIGSIGNFAKNLKMQAKWQQKKDTKQYTKKEEAADPVKDKWAIYKEELDRMRENQKGSEESMRIMNKISVGASLTAEELETLKVSSPMTYQKVKQLETEKKQYEKELKECKTKEDVQRLKTAHVGQILSKVNSIVNNANIPKMKKLELVMQEKASLEKINQAEREFVESGEYAKLETDAEKRQREHEENEIKKGELEGPKKEETGQEELEGPKKEETGQEELEGPKKEETGQEDIKGAEESAKAETVKTKEYKAPDQKQGDTHEHRVRKAEYERARASYLQESDGYRVREEEQHEKRHSKRA